MSSDSQEIRRSILTKWHESLSKYGNLFSSDSISGTSPPSVFVGSYNYPKVFVGPMVPPIHGNTELLDSPEKWKGKTLEEIINFRLNLVRGIQKIAIEQTDGRYIENLQEVTMSSKPTDLDLIFNKNVSSNISIDGESAPFGPVGEIKSAKFSGSTSTKPIEKIFYDKDINASDAVLKLYNSGIEISKIQKCFSIGMLGKKRKLVPTKWSITATDDIISKSIIEKILENSLIDTCKIFSYEHLGNMFSVILFPHRWIFEMIEAWYSNGILGWALNEEYIYGDDGKLQNPGFLDYRIPVASDLPMIDPVILEIPNPGHPYGVRGVGETSIVPPLAAISNAISRATSIRFSDLPMSPPKVLKAIKDKQRGNG